MAQAANDENKAADAGDKFPTDKCPDKIPDLSEHKNHMADVLIKDPDVYYNLKDKVTKLGVPFAKCIKTGMDNKSHPMIKTVGMVAGDEECYELFSDLFTPVIAARHPESGFGPNFVQPTDLTSDLDPTPIDPTGKFSISTRVRTARNIRGFRLSPSMDTEERRKIQDIIVKAVLASKKFGSDMEYFPLAGNKSYEPKPNGMTEEEMEAMREGHYLFQKPDSTLLIASGMDRDWPDGRGIVSNKEKTMHVWVNEEDMIRVISMEKGSDIKSIFERFAALIGEVESGIKEQGHEYMHNKQLGYVSTCPSNLGTGIRASVLLIIPLFSKRDDFRPACLKLRLGVRGFKGVDSQSEDGIFDISNAERLGKSEVQLVNVMIKGCSTLVKWETALKEGKNIDAEVAALLKE